jgi:hypothetical protein
VLHNFEVSHINNEVSHVKVFVKKRIICFFFI